MPLAETIAKPAPAGFIRHFRPCQDCGICAACLEAAKPAAMPLHKPGAIIMRRRYDVDEARRMRNEAAGALRYFETQYETDRRWEAAFGWSMPPAAEAGLAAAGRLAAAEARYAAAQDAMRYGIALDFAPELDMPA